MPRASSADALEHESGLLGLAGTADMREVLGAEAAATPARARRRRLPAPPARRRSPRWRRRSAGSTRSCSPAASASARAASAQRALPAARVPRRGARRRERGAPRRRRPRQIGGAMRAFVVEAREDLEIARAGPNPARVATPRPGAVPTAPGLGLVLLSARRHRLRAGHVHDRASRLGPDIVRSRDRRDRDRCRRDPCRRLGVRRAHGRTVAAAPSGSSRSAAAAGRLPRP